MTNESPRHPGHDTMAAFVEGTLPPAELAVVAKHLAGCVECRTVVSETTRFTRDEHNVVSIRRPRWRILSVAAAAVLAVLVLIPIARTRFAPQDSRARLVSAAPPDHRLIESRLAGFPWRRLQAPPRGGAPPNPADLKLVGAAGEVLERTAGDPSAAALHARGLAQLLIGRNAEAVEALQRSANASESAAIRNDLAAARYRWAVSEEHPSQLPLALADANRALELDRHFADAQFNRALILAEMGLPDLARKAWEAYLTLDPGSEWSAEARARLRELGHADSSSFAPAALTAASVKSSSLDDYVRRYPHETRTWGEGPLLAEWADAAKAGDARRTAATLAAAHALGDALIRINGECLLGDVVAVIESAHPNSARALSDGHRLYRDARIDYSKRRNAEAEQGLRRAAAIFRRDRSPMAELASYFAACAAWDQNRNEEARGELRALAASLDTKRHRALTAQLHWQLAVDANSVGDWGAATRHAGTAATIFDSLGERADAAFMHGVSAIALDVIGARDLAWKRRILAFHGLITAAQRGRRSTIVHAAAMTLSAIDRRSAALAMVDLMIDSAREGDPAQLAAGLTTRARIASLNGDLTMARRSVDDARAAASRVADAGLRAMLDAQIDLAPIAGDPHSTIASLNRALGFFKDGRLAWFRADAFSNRARAYRSLGDDDAALADYRSAIQELEKQRGTIDDAALRLTFLDTASRIIEETIDLHLSRHAVDDAFRVADRAHALLDAANPSTTQPAIARVPPGVALVEYVVLPDALVIFCISEGRLSAERIEMDRQEFVARVASFAESIRRRAPIDEIQKTSAEMYRLLIAPVRSRLASVEEVFVVPDRELYAVPFGALFDAGHGRYLVEDFTITIAPSASRSQGGNTQPPALTPALVIADPPTPQWPPLRASRSEAQRIAQSYGAALLVGSDATRERFVDLAKQSALIHYAGHANSDASESYGALLFADSKDGSGALFSGEIARLSLPLHPLVILAACGTFRGDTSHVAGATTLARSFLLAGARAVIGTLWELDDDAAAALFLRLHEHLRAGASPARALRAAQIDMIRSADARLQHPATWPVEILSSL